MENKDKPAFAHDNQKMAEQVGRGIAESEYNSYTKGLTKREYFAAMAMQGLMHQDGYFGGHTDMEHSAKWCIQIADELLKQLSK